MVEELEKATIYLHDPFNVKSIQSIANSGLVCLNLIGTSIDLEDLSNIFASPSL